LDCPQSDATGACLDQDRLAFHQRATRKEAVMGSPKSNRQCGRRGHIDRIRNEPGSCGWRRTQFSMRSRQVEARDSLSDTTIMNIGTDRDDFAGSGISDDMGGMRRSRGCAIDQIAAFYGNRLDTDHYAIGWARRISDVRIPQNIGRPGVIVDGGFHG
jgi:hypothetical protein